MYKSICIILSVDCDSRPITIRHLISSPLSSQSVTLLLTITLPFSLFTNIHTDTQMHTHTHTCTHIYTLSYTDTHIYTLTHTHTITHTHMHTHTHTHAQIHTHTHQIINVSFLTMHFAENQRTPFKSNPVWSKWQVKEHYMSRVSNHRNLPPCLSRQNMVMCHGY